MAGPLAVPRIGVLAKSNSNTNTVVVPWTLLTAANTGINLSTPTQDPGNLASVSEVNGVWTFVGDNHTGAATSGSNDLDFTYWKFTTFPSGIADWASSIDKVLHLRIVKYADLSTSPLSYQPRVQITLGNTGSSSNGGVAAGYKSRMNALEGGGCNYFQTTIWSENVAINTQDVRMSFLPFWNYSSLQPRSYRALSLSFHDSTGTMLHSGTPSASPANSSNLAMTEMRLYWGHGKATAVGATLTTQWQFYYAVTTSISSPV